jgi:hypothetical protein
MFDWFDKMMRDVIWKGIDDFFGGVTAQGESAIPEKLQTIRSEKFQGHN